MISNFRPHRRATSSYILFFLLASSLVGPAWADDAPGANAGNEASAESLFVRGQEFMAAGEYEKACAAFDASQKYDPAVGTLLNLARCFESAGLTASAWSTFSAAASMARQEGQDEREVLARKEVARLRTLVPQVIIQVEGLSSATIVKLDGLVLAHDVLSFGSGVDPGEHQIEVTEPGKMDVQKTIQVTAASASKPLMIRIEPLKDQARASEEPPTSGASLQTDSTSTQSPRGWSSLRWVGFGTGVVGLTSVVIGAVLGAAAKSKANGIDAKECNEQGCSEPGADDIEAAQVQLDVGYAVGIVGGVLAAGGVTLFVLAPQKSSAEIALTIHPPSPAGGGLSLTGSF